MSQTVINLPNHVTGDTFAGYQFNALDEAGLPYNLTGATISVALRYGSITGTIQQTFTIGSGLSWVDQALGKFKINQQSIAWAAGKYFFEVEITFADTTQQSPIKGTWTIQAQTTP